MMMRRGRGKEEEEDEDGEDIIKLYLMKINIAFFSGIFLL
jgi:hypothetical protein